MGSDRIVAVALGYTIATLFWVLAFIMPMLGDIQELEAGCASNTENHHHVSHEGTLDDTQTTLPLTDDHQSHSATRAEHTLLSLVHTMREYLPPDGISKDEFINRVLGVLDNDEMAELVSKLEAGK